MSDPLLEIRDLKVAFSGFGGRRTQAVDGVSFTIGRGRTLGLVGESGSGKSVTALSVMRLLAQADITGEIIFEGRRLLDLTATEMQNIRGNRAGMIFQEPMTSLNPSLTVGEQIGETLQRHRGLSHRAARQEAKALLRRVSIPAPDERVDAYPHKLSGGMRQRVMIAMALACSPALLIADEPTTALDATIQAQILDLLRNLKKETGTAILLITHDLGVVAEMCDEVAVMYAGQIVETGRAAEIFRQPQHPYTVGLMGSIPLLTEKRERLSAIPGTVPALTQSFQGCRFAARCPFADARCRTQAPPLQMLPAGQISRCWKAPLEALVA